MSPACHFRRASEDAYATLGEDEVAQPVAGVRLSPRFRGTGRNLFNTGSFENRSASSYLSEKAYRPQGWRLLVPTLLELVRG
jgi:hypothetical protein